MSLRNACKNLKINYSFIDKLPKKTKEEIFNIKKNIIDIPLVINGKEIYHQEKKLQFSPYQHSTVASRYSIANSTHLNQAIESSIKSQKIWKEISLDKKYDIFSKAADLISDKYYHKLLAATIVGQGKNIYQAEIDAICELADFLNFNVKYHQEITKEQPLSSDNVINKSKWTGLNGFVASISPFNFTAIGGHLATAPLLMDNPVIWKPSDYSILSNYLIYQIMVEAGMPAMETIQSATITNAKLLKMENELGQIKGGFLADIIAVNEDPTKKIESMENVVFVMKNGVIYKN